MSRRPLAAAAALALAAAPLHAQRVTTGLFAAASFAPATSEKMMGVGGSLGIPVLGRFSLELELAEMLGGASPAEAADATSTEPATPKSATFDYHAHGAFDFELGPRAALVIGPGLAYSASSAEQKFGTSLVTGLALRVSRLATANVALVTDHFSAAPSFVQTVHVGLQIGWRFSAVAADEAEPAKVEAKPAARGTKPAARPAAKAVSPKPVAKPAPRPVVRAEPEPVAEVEQPEPPKPVVKVEPKPEPKPEPKAAPAPVAGAVSAVDSAAIARPVFFATGSAVLDANAVQALHERAVVLARYPDATLRIVGHTDARGGRRVNDALARRRAEAVRDALRGFGVADARLTAEGEGAAHPAVEGSDAAAYARNRRSELVLHVGPTTMPACVTLSDGATASEKDAAARDGRPACVAKRYY